MKRVVAMIQPVRSNYFRVLPKSDSLRSGINALAIYLGGFEGELDDRPKPKLSEIIRLANEVKRKFEAYDGALNEHDCSESGGSLVPIGSNEDLDTLLRREGFNSADMVAIVKLDDINTRVTLVDGLRPCPFCAVAAWNKRPKETFAS